MKFKEALKNFVGNVQEGISRFAFAFVLSVVIAALLSIEILWSPRIEYLGDLLFALSLGVFASVLLTVVSEKTRLNKKLANLISAVCGILCFVITYFMHFDGDYFLMGYFGLILAIVCFTLRMLFDKGNSLVLIPHLVKSVLFSVSVGAILSAGVSLCLWAFQELIFDFDSDLYPVVNIFIWFVGVVNLFLAYIPKKDEEIKLPKLFKVIVVNVALPIYILLMVILYVYLAKIVVTRNMPVGQINWFASFATLFFVFFLFCVRQYEDKFTGMFTKFAGWFVIPVIIMQLVAIYERVSAYGLTAPRTISLILVAVGIIFAVVSVMGKKVENVLWALGIIILVFTLVPKMNVIDMPKASQSALLEKYLLKNNMLKDGNVVANAEIDEYDKDRIRSAYSYLRDCEGEFPHWFEKINNSDFKTVYGFELYSYARYDDGWEHYSYRCDYEAGKFLDIADYRKLQFVEYSYSKEYPLFETNIDGVKYSFDMLKVFDEIKQKYGDAEIVEPVALDENMTLFFDYSYYNLREGNVDSMFFKGYLFVK